MKMTFVEMVAELVVETSSRYLFLMAAQAAAYSTIITATWSHHEHRIGNAKCQK